MLAWLVSFSSLGWRLVSSRAGMAVIILAMLFAWHVIDKRQAVSAAREGYVRQFELTAAQAELAALRRRAAATEEANRVLQEKMQVAEGQALRFAAELEAYQNETDINPDGVVDSDLIGRLRSN